MPIEVNAQSVSTITVSNPNDVISGYQSLKERKPDYAHSNARMRMSRAFKIAMALALSPLLLEAVGKAVPRISTYVTSGTLSKTVPDCIAAMKTSALQTGFGASQEVVMDANGKAVDFHADNTNGSMHFTARCNSVSGTWGIALSGTNANQTFSAFRKVAEFVQYQ